MVDNEWKDNKIQVLTNLVPAPFVADLVGISEKRHYRKIVTVENHSGPRRDLCIMRWIVRLKFF